MTQQQRAGPMTRRSALGEIAQRRAALLASERRASLALTGFATGTAMAVHPGPDDESIWLLVRWFAHGWEDALTFARAHPEAAIAWRMRYDLEQAEDMGVSLEKLRRENENEIASFLELWRVGGVQPPAGREEGDRES